MSDELEPPVYPTEEATEGSTFPTLEEMAALLPQYEFHDILGVGGMGAVYLARQAALDRWVAIKLLPASASLNEDDASRFIAEARSMARLTHAHIAAVHDFGQTGQGHLYLVMEHVNGLDLHRLIHRGELTHAHIRSLVLQLCDALQYAHDHGVIHRDIKPANILITENWQAKIVDFGLARDKNADSSGETEYGTPDYVAPERLQAGAPVDHRADIYSLGIVIHEMFTKLTPQAAGAAAGKDLPAEFASIVSRCMMVDPARRFQKCSEIKSFLSAATIPSAAATAPPAHRPPPPHLQAKVRQGQKIIARPQESEGPGKWLWAAACIFLLMISGWFIQHQRNPDTGSQSKQNAQAKKIAATTDQASPTASKAGTEATPQKANATVPAATVISNAPSGPFKPDPGDFAILKRLKGHNELVYANAILSDQRRAVSGGHDDTLKLWDITTGSELKSFPSPVGDIHGIQAASDGKSILLWSFRSDQVAIFDIEQGRTISSIKAPTNRLSLAAWAADQKSVYLLCNDANGGVYYWDPSKGAVLQQFSDWTRAAYHIFPLPATKPEDTPQVLVIGTTMKPNPNQGPDSTQNLISDKAWASLFSVPDHRLIRHLPDYTNIRNRLSLSPDGSTIVGGLGTVYLLDVPALTTRFSMDAPSNVSCSSTTWAGSGRLIVCGYANGSLLIREAETGAELASLDIGLRTNAVSISQDEGWMLVSGFPIDIKKPKAEDYDALVIRLPDLNKLGSDNGFLALATRQVSRLESFDPELAALRSQASPPDAVTNDDQLRAQVRDLTNKYGAALKRSAVTASPKDQISMNAEADAIAKGTPVPDPATDAATSGDHKRFRGIYRQQLAELETRRQVSASALRQSIDASVQTLAAKRQQANDRLGTARCGALLASLGDLKPFNAIVASAFVSSATSAPPAAPVLASATPSTAPATAPLALPPAATVPVSASATKVPFANGVKIEVAIGRPSKIKGGDFDDKMQVMEPKIKLTNTSTTQSYDGFKATFLLIGESAVDIKVMKVLQREEFPVSIPIRQFIENKPPSVTTQYDTTGAKFGFKYDGWVIQITDLNGQIVHTKSTSPTLEKMPEQVQGLKAEQCYDKKLKPVAEPELRF
ncbi:protein kinase [Prosthecobacter sp.]|uniref:WD40 repeat domain-containing serine/threonine protein kinase n=1 Tax=Prosthecobacter sp. TaxID=1965333 RepID=UPI002ABB647D|nr:protein kinase [Prosthecobacter sp.]MDZ4403775.1 protein kinase [Prosthecobacter sp.]